MFIYDVRILISFLLYNILFMILKRKRTKKLAANTTSMTHASTAVFIWLFGTPEMFTINSTGYFIYDIFYEGSVLFEEKINILAYSLIYHHIVLIYYMSLDPNIFNWFNIIGVGEFGNLPSYMVYYYLKTEPNSNKVKLWKKTQKIVYSIVRVPVGFYLGLNDVMDPYKLNQILYIVPLYILGVIWTIIILLK